MIASDYESWPHIWRNVVMLQWHQESPAEMAARKSNPLRYFPLFAKMYLKIKTKNGDLIPFDFNEAQRRVWALIEAQEDNGLPVRIIVLKARQMGISTFSEGYTFFQVVTNRYRRALVLAHDLDATEGLFQMSKLFYDELPEEIRPMRRYVNRRELVFENPNEKERIDNPGLRSQFEVQTSNNTKAGRSGTLQHLHASEVSFWQNPEELSIGMFPAIPPTHITSVILESTAHGSGNWFHSFWKTALRHKSEYEAIFLPWYIMPEYRARAPKRMDFDEEEREIRKQYHLDNEQLQWRRQRIAEFEADNAGLGLDSFHQEYPNTEEEAFLAAGLPALDHKGIRRCSDNAEPGIRFYVTKGLPKENPNGSFQVWEKPRDGEQYTIGVDVSGGIEHGDLSVVQVLRNRGRVQVGEWAGYVDPISFAPIIHNIAIWYNEGLVAIEINNQGIATQRALIDDYWNIYQWKYLDSVTNRASMKLGWVTTISTKPMMISFTNHCLQHDLCVINSIDLRDECYSYVRKGIDLAYSGASPNCFDDRVMAFMIALTVQHIEEHGLNFGPSRNRVKRDRSYHPIEYDDETGETRFVGPPLPVSRREDYNTKRDWRLQ